MIDDSEIDEIIWEEIADSPSRGDFVCYAVHAPVSAKYREKAHQRVDEMGNTEDQRPLCYPRAVARIRELAEGGNATAIFHMGKIHAIGISVPQDLPSAVAWYKKAIAAGEPRAFANLGWFYQSGYGVKKDAEKAFALLSRGADGGVISARAAVGMMMLAGEGCPADAARGITMLEEAFDQGYVNAGNHLADVYFSGRLVPGNSEAGHRWLFRVAEKGDERTMAILGHYLVAGTHGKTDVPKGLSLLKTAADRGFTLAFAWMGSLYRAGTGVEKSPEKARQWYEKGIAAGSKKCEDALVAMLLENSPKPIDPGNRPLH